MSANGSPSVIKLGGSLLEDPQKRKTILESIAERWQAREALIVVHGGGQKVDTLLSRLNIPKRTHQGLRITDGPTLEAVVSILAGLVNKTLVAEFSAEGVAAVGFSGADRWTLEAEFHPELDGVALGFVGRVTAVNPAFIHLLLGCRTIPIVAPIAIGPNGTLLNINADQAASALAAALKAKRLLFLTDVDGLFDGNGCVMPKLTLAEAQSFLQSDFVNGGMRPKLIACMEAVSAGVSEVIIAGPSQYFTALSGGKGGTLLVAA